MRILSWNVNGVRAAVRNGLLEVIAALNPNIVCLQETKAQDTEVQKALISLNKYHQYYNSAERKGYAGTCLLSNKEFISYKNDMGIPKHDSEGRLQCAEYEKFFLVNVYVPNSGQELKRLAYRKQWDLDFLNYLKNLEAVKPVIVCGDFNVAHKAIDLKNPVSNYNQTAGYTQIEIGGMDNLINAGFVDSFRYLYPNEVAYTYWSYRFKARERNVGWRIDYFLVSKSLINSVKSVKVLSQYFGSDHCPIVLEVDL